MAKLVQTQMGRMAERVGKAVDDDLAPTSDVCDSLRRGYTKEKAVTRTSESA
jgi:hypothetical protein